MRGDECQIQDYILFRSSYCINVLSRYDTIFIQIYNPVKIIGFIGFWSMKYFIVHLICINKYL